jgi:hypothetical protein
MIYPLSPGNPIAALYHDAIERSQNGAHENAYKRMRYYLLHQLVQQAARRFPSLPLVECGCWHGHSTLIIDAIIAESRAHLHVFDSFEGLSRFVAKDKSAVQSCRPEHFASNQKHLASLVSNRVTLHRGWIPEVFVDIGQISFASIDVDLYEPTRDALAYWYDRLMPGGIMYFDDYGYTSFPGATMAVKEHLSECHPHLFIEAPMGSAFLIK